MFYVDNTFQVKARPPVLVVSHERSGTHFLMNTLAACYGYVNSDWINLDRCNGDINYSYPPHLRQFLLARAAKPQDQIVKSHHQAEFFGNELARVANPYAVFYIYRDPVAVMLSCWRFMHRWHWMEGPKVADPITYARAAPCGHLMRYQLRQYPTMLARWAAHVDGWLAATAAVPGIVLVRYEDLDLRFEETARGLGRSLGLPPAAITRPSRFEHVILGGPEDPAGLGIPPDIEALRSLCRQTVGTTMTRLGYYAGKAGAGQRNPLLLSPAPHFEHASTGPSAHQK